MVDTHEAFWKPGFKTTPPRANDSGGTAIYPLPFRDAPPTDLPSSVQKSSETPGWLLKQGGGMNAVI